jgi:hypothetical protein
MAGMKSFRGLGLVGLLVPALLGASLLFAESSLEAKLGELRARYEKGSDTPKEFAIEEAEANGFLRDSRELPKGVEDPWIKFEDNVAIVGAMVDLDQVRGELPDSMVFQLLSGRVPVEVTARVSGDQGEGKLELEQVLLSGVELPTSLVETLASQHDTSGILPPGFRLGAPFALPYDLESIHCQQGSVLVRQRATSPDE